MRVYRFRAPRWRQGPPTFSEDPDPWLFGLGDVVLGLISAALGVIASLLLVVVGLPINVVRALVSDERTVEASCAVPQAMRMTWRTDTAHVDAVADQVARQLELGYNRVEPHNAVFEGFAET